MSNSANQFVLRHEQAGQVFGKGAARQLVGNGPPNCTSNSYTSQQDSGDEQVHPRRSR